jgi:branched-chain amino acid transport system substrate-binding protein
MKEFRSVENKTEKYLHKGGKVVKKRNHLLSAAICALAAAGLLPASSQAAEQQGIEGKVITIGADAILSGSTLAGQAHIATGVYFDMINRQGGVNGYTIKYIQRDNALQPAQGVAVARQLAKSDKVFAMIVAGSVNVQAVAPIAAQLQVPMLTFADSDLLKPVIPNMFGVNVRYTRLPLYDADYAIKKLDAKNVAYVYEDNSIGRPGMKTLPDFVPSDGGKLVASVPFPLDTTDWAPYAARLKDAGTQAVVFFSGSASGLSGLQKAADAIGYHPKYVAMYSHMTPGYLKLAGPLAEGTYIDSVSEPLDSTSAHVKEFVEEMKKAGQENAISGFGGQGWTGAAIIVEGIRRATANGGELTWDSFEKALETLNGTPLGTYPGITYSKDDHTGASKASMYQVQNGKFIQVLPLSDIP